MKHTELENLFLAYWKMLAPGYPRPIPEYKFDKKRRWRFDFCWVKQKVACELEGGIWTGGAHTRGKHFISDCDKYNAATAQGWRVFRFTTNHLNENPKACIDLVKSMIS